MTTHLCTAALIAAAALLPACGSKSWNNSITLHGADGENVKLDSFDADTVVPPAEGIIVAEVRRPEPSFTGISRDNWDTVTFLVPTHGTEHGALGYRNVMYPTVNVRDDGAYPTADTCLRTYDSADNWSQIKTAVVAPFAGAADIVLAIPRTFRAPPGRKVMDRPMPYQRARHEPSTLMESAMDMGIAAETAPNPDAEPAPAPATEPAPAAPTPAPAPMPVTP